MPPDIAIIMIIMAILQARYYFLHETYVSANYLSSPQIV